RVWKTKHAFPTWTIATDLPVTTIVDATSTQEGETGILSAFFIGKDADEYFAIEEKECIGKVLDHIEKIWPGTKQKYSGEAARYYWPRAIPIASPGYFTKLQPQLNQPHGHVLFAGDYTEQPGLDGAVYSGARSAKQVK